jgi:hypothetical protein
MRVRFHILPLFLLSVLVLNATAAPAPVEHKKIAKTVKIAFDNTPWRAVFELLAETTGKPVITNFCPQGSLTFQGPPGMEYTIPELIDIIHEGLLNQRPQPYFLIQDERKFTLVAADEKVDPRCFPLFRNADLEQHGKTELFRIELCLMRLDADEIAPTVEAMVGLYGNVVSLKSERRNTLLVADTATNLHKIGAKIQALEDTVD